MTDLCRQCHKREVRAGRGHCDHCLDGHASRMQIRRMAARDAGLCLRCMVNDAGGLTACRKCRLEASQRYYARKAVVSGQLSVVS